jgi:ABC-type antimicrobial peptide transport system permease subunit
MSKLGSLLGKEYEDHKQSILTRTLKFNEATFKIVIPSVARIEAIYNYRNSPNLEKIEIIYQQLKANLVIKPEDKVEEKENDIVVNGRSIRESALNTHLTQYQILEYFKFIVPQEGQDINTLTYEDINTEIPLQIQIEFMNKINEVLSPDYKEISSK